MLLPCRRAGSDVAGVPDGLRRKRRAPTPARVDGERARHVAALESALQNTEERLRLITETSVDIICFFRTDGVFAYVSRASNDILGIAPEDIVGTHFSNYFEPAELGSAAAIFDRVAGGEMVAPVEVTTRHRDGHAVPLEVSAAPIIRGGTIVGVHGIARDISKRKQAEEGLRWYSSHLERLLIELDDRKRRDKETYAAHLRRHHETETALRDNETLMSAALEMAPLGVAIVGVDGCVLRASQRFRDLAGQSQATLAGSPLDGLVETPDRSRFRRVQDLLSTGTTDFETINARLARVPPGLPPVRFSLALVRQATGEPRCLVVAVEPITGGT